MFNILIVSTLVCCFILPTASGYKMTFGILLLVHIPYNLKVHNIPFLAAMFHLIVAWYPLWFYKNTFPNLTHNSTDGGGPLGKINFKCRNDAFENKMPVLHLSSVVLLDIEGAKHFCIGSKYFNSADLSL